jgi:excinuclease ABC subunit C
MRTDPATLPDACGVYLFRAASGRVLYVGKAINIRSRVRSHLQDKKNPKEIKLRDRSESVDWIATGSELEALVLEDTLIKRYKPRFNVRMKDDKSYPYLMITNDAYPAIHQVRGLQRGKGEYFGPHSDPRAVRKSLRWLRKIFPVRSCRRDLSRPSRPCLEHHLGRCLAPCNGKVPADDYSLMVEGLRRFLSGRREEVIEELERRMWRASSDKEYERAAMLRDIVHGLKKIRQGQKVVLVKGGDLDAVHINDKGTGATVVKVREGRVVDAISFSLEGEEPLTGPAGDFLSSLYVISGYIPPNIVIDKLEMEKDRKEELEKFLSDKRGRKVKIVRPRGEERRSLIEMARRNQRLFEIEQLRELESTDVLSILKNTLNLANVPVVIEGFDVSHLGGTGTVASMVQFKGGRPKKTGYRRFKIRSDQNDDYLSMKEAVFRRYKRILDHDGEMPDLILIDGGKGQLNAALEAFSDLSLEEHPDIVSIAKKEEELYRPGRSLPIVLKRIDPSLRLLQRVRDEAHRFAVSYQRKLREKDVTILTRIEGVGKARARKLLTCFMSIDEILKAGPDGINEKCSFSTEVSESIIEFLKEEWKNRT